MFNKLTLIKKLHINNPRIFHILIKTKNFNRNSSIQLHVILNNIIIKKNEPNANSQRGPALSMVLSENTDKYEIYEPKKTRSKATRVNRKAFTCSHF